MSFGDIVIRKKGCLVVRHRVDFVVHKLVRVDPVSTRGTKFTKNVKPLIVLS